MKSLIYLFVLFCLQVSLYAQTTNILADQVKQARTQSASVVEANLFETIAEYDLAEKVGDRTQPATWLQLDPTALNQLHKAAPDHLNLTLPHNGATVVLELVQVTITTPGFVVTDQDDTVYSLPQGRHYRGVLGGRPGSIAALSVFPDEVIGVVADHEAGNLVLGRDQQHADGQTYVFFHEDHAKQSNQFTCQTPAVPAKTFEQERLELQATQPLSPKSGEQPLQKNEETCVGVYFECDYNLFRNKGRNIGATANWVTGMFNVVAAIYANEGIPVSIDEIMVWTTQDSYNTIDSETALQQFRERSHDASLGHLLALAGNSLRGIAYRDALCTRNGYAYSRVQGSYAQLPNYSWTVMVVAHEMGHNLGSPHTHNCGWDGGALDNCAPTEGSCARGPAPPSSGGTIMSYCHQAGNPGINLNAGFGPQPGDLIRERVAAAQCLIRCPFAGPSLSVTTRCLNSNTLRWTTLTGADRYEVYVGTSPYPENARRVYEGSGNWTRVYVSAGTSEYAWVRARVDGDWSKYSNRQIVRYQSPCRRGKSD